jgi:hypothetical protein
MRALSSVPGHSRKQLRRLGIAGGTAPALKRHRRGSMPLHASRAIALPITPGLPLA